MTNIFNIGYTTIFISEKTCGSAIFQIIRSDEPKTFSFSVFLQVLHSQSLSKTSIFFLCINQCKIHYFLLFISRICLQKVRVITSCVMLLIHFDVFFCYFFYFSSQLFLSLEFFNRIFDLLKYFMM